MELRTSRKKFKASLALFFIALAVLAVGVLLMVFGDKIGLESIGGAVSGVAMVVYIVLMMISLFLNWSYRNNSIVAGASSTALYVFQFIFLLPMIILFAILFVYALLHGYAQGGENLKKIKIRDEDGTEYILTQLYAGSVDYKDQNGDIWTTRDGGATFECISRIKVKDKQGDDYTLTPKTEFASTDYADQNGDTWQTFNTFGNANYERKPRVRGEDGTEYILTRSSEFSDLYTDQNGNWWKSWDGGKTFERY